MLPGRPGGASLGAARGAITIDTSSLQQAAQTARTVAAQIEQAMGGINTSAQRAQTGLNQSSIGLRDIDNAAAAAAGGLRGVAGSLGIAGFVALGVAAANAAANLARIGEEAERAQMAIAYMAGGGREAARQLEAIQEASGDTVSKLDAMRIANQAMALDMANSSEEFERLVRAARGVTFVSPIIHDVNSAISEMALTAANLSFRRLDQLGLTTTEVRKRMTELRAETAGMSESAAMLEAVIQLLNEKYGELVDKAVSPTQQLGAAWKDLRAQMGRNIADDIGQVSNALTSVVRWLERVASESPNAARGLDDVAAAGRRAASIGPGTPLTRQPDVISAGVAYIEAQRAIQQQASEQRADEHRSYEQRIVEITRQYGEQRAQTIRQHEQTIAREAEDFARRRARQAAELERDIAGINADRARQEAEWQADLDERLADIRADGNARLSEIEEDYQRDRERAARGHEERLLEAASRLDAAAVLAEQRRYAEEEQEARESHDERVSDEQEALDKRIAQEREAHADRLAEARAADARRIAEMRENLAEQQRVEDEDRALRLERQAEDHAAQLDQMAANQARQLAQAEQAHSERMAQINRHEADELKAAEEAHAKALEELGLYNKGWKAIQDARQRQALEDWDNWWKDFNRRFAMHGPRPQATEGNWEDPYSWSDIWRNPPDTTPPAGIIPPNVPPAAPIAPTTPLPGGNTITIETGAITVHGAPGQSAEEIARAVDARLLYRLQELAS